MESFGQNPTLLYGLDLQIYVTPNMKQREGGILTLQGKCNLSQQSLYQHVKLDVCTFSDSIACTL